MHYLLLGWILSVPRDLYLSKFPKDRAQILRLKLISFCQSWRQYVPPKRFYVWRLHTSSPARRTSSWFLKVFRCLKFHHVHLFHSSGCKKLEHDIKHNDSCLQRTGVRFDTTGLYLQCMTSRFERRAEQHLDKTCTPCPDTFPNSFCLKSDTSRVSSLKSLCKRVY
jgi:hypothetical protein